MVGVAQLVEHQVVALRVAGSSPVAHPNVLQRGVGSPEYGTDAAALFVPSFAIRTPHFIAPVAQLDRASDFESGCRRFEPCRARHIKDSY